MENGQKTLNDLFDGKKIFKIPEYQRAYAWGEKQLFDFMDDFRNQKLGKDYFFGTILFQENGKQGPYEIIEVVDGQQRITTLVIFLNTLFDLYTDVDDETKEMYYETFIKYKSEYKLKVLQDDNDFFETYVLGDHEVHTGLITTPSQKKLLYSKEFFYEELSKYSQEELKEILSKVESTKILTYSVMDKAEATLIFETTNDRGKQLTNLEKTKSFMMYKTYIAADDPEFMLSKIQSRFSEIYKSYTVIEDMIDENSILQYNFIAFEDWKVTQKVKGYQRYMEQMKENVNELIIESHHDAFDYIDKYTMNLRESYAIMKALLTSDIPEFHDLLILGNMANFYPLLIKTYKFDRSPDLSKFREVCELLEKYSFRVYSILNSRSNAGQSKLYGLAKDFNGDYSLLKDELKSAIYTYSSNADFISYLTWGDFFDYSSNIKNYFYWKYENHLRDVEQPVASPIPASVFRSKDRRKKFSIEHIMPQNPKASSKIATGDLSFGIMDDEFEEKYLHSIGNLTIDPMSANASKGNADIETKNNLYFKRSPFKTQNELDNFIVNDQWGKEAIIKRQEKLVEFAKIRWCSFDAI
ncbi:protein of unknown function [Acetoanaerobium sticklandii]|uniref:DUF262 domain-containing protein n=1 Tax=Acetoanaerobium sticklandii (strain ATCC 12662 / DSM 519 / JCM 1433 / CCUG 9281 / NCIMB 10654 / HF) TaxID=499177 RepID=E3PVU2_ACESD|nr:DUF262 domain-containing protein [Acetoanaerobium sticklandii]CBH22645.1 protein of unknown function [Acetoanaerobium sticklandii]